MLTKVYTHIPTIKILDSTEIRIIIIIFIFFTIMIKHVPSRGSAWCDWMF